MDIVIYVMVSRLCLCFYGTDTMVFMKIDTAISVNLLS